MKRGVRFKRSPSDSDLREAFAERYIPEPNSGCWLWIGNYLAKRNGYGCFTMRPLGIYMERAHRLSWKLHRGSISKDEHVLHKCDTPACVNPAHLFLGDQAINMRDCVAKGRRKSMRAKT